MGHDGRKPGPRIQVERLLLPANNVFELPKQQHLNTHGIRIAETLPGTLKKFFDVMSVPSEDMKEAKANQRRKPILYIIFSILA
jgi:hypothetical protein